MSFKIREYFRSYFIWLTILSALVFIHIMIVDQYRIESRERIEQLEINIRFKDYMDAVNIYDMYYELTN